MTPTGATQATGQGWQQPTDLHTALSRARPGDDVWVAVGTYRTSEVGDRTTSFLVPAGVNVYGGFKGTEAGLRGRDREQRSTLSGRLGRKGDVTDNAYTVVHLHSKALHPSTIDGFRITGGNSRTFTTDVGPRQAGGGLYILAGEGSTTGHYIKNCTFEGNSAHNGGAVYIDGGRAVFSGCRFVNNSADFNGGAVYLNGSDGKEAKPTFQQCTFLDNASNSGGALTNNGAAGEASPRLIDCRFVNNVSRINGAAIYNIQRETGRCEPRLEQCEFVGNASILGDDVAGLGSGEAAKPRREEAAKRGGTLRPVRAKRR